MIKKTELTKYLSIMLKHGVGKMCGAIKIGEDVSE